LVYSIFGGGGDEDDNDNEDDVDFDDNGDVNDGGYDNVIDDDDHHHHGDEIPCRFARHKGSFRNILEGLTRNHNSHCCQCSI